MNLFQKYGIKEVADVVFYSITAVGDEEFYTPVLFLDTLKVSTLEKSAEKVEAKGGKGNKKLITWNFGKEITLNLEDALFSPASMSMIWGGRLDSKLSDYTSAIVKCNLANKYGDLNYSTKAYPSPALTDSEWDIVFQIAEKLGLDSGSNTTYPSRYVWKEEDDNNSNQYIAENRQFLITKYFKRLWDGFNFTSTDIPFIEIGGVNKANFKSLLFGSLSKDIYGEYFKVQAPGIQCPAVSRAYSGKVYVESMTINDGYTTLEQLLSREENSDLFRSPYGSITLNISYKIYVSKSSINTEGWVTSDNDVSTSINNAHTFNQSVLCEIRYGIQNLESENIDDRKLIINNTTLEPVVFWCTSADNYGENLIDNWSSLIYMWKVANNFSLQNDSGAIFPCLNPEIFLQTVYGYDSVAIKDSFDSIINTAGKAIPAKIPQQIISELNTLSKIGTIETSFQDIEVIDRMEKCIVKDRKGFTIDPVKQKENLFRYYADDKSSSYTIYYDAKTMLPLFRIQDDNIDGIEPFKIKMGTIYYKWTRTVKYKEYNDDGILGKTLVIDAETFPDTYKIVGETYIRNQKTGKDQRYQFVIHRANVSSDTSVTLEAEGDPTTFSMQIDVLTPPNDIMMELKQYDVEEDVLEGGTRIVPQKSKYTYTPTNIEYIQKVAEKNEEIY